MYNLNLVQGLVTKTKVSSNDSSEETWIQLVFMSEQSKRGWSGEHSRLEGKLGVRRQRSVGAADPPTSVHGGLLLSFGVGHLLQVLVDDVIELGVEAADVEDDHSDLRVDGLVLLVDK